MPSVNSSSSESPLAITRSLSELEQELRLDHQRARERVKSQVADVEEGYKRTLADRDRAYETTIAQVKSTAGEDLKNERLSSQVQLDQLKKETYDKLGKYNGTDGQILRDQYDELKNETDVQIEADRRMLEESEQRLKNRLEEEQILHEKALTEMNEKTRESAERAYSESSRTQKEQFNEYKNHAEKRIKSLIKDQQEALNLERRKSEKALTDTRADYENNYEKGPKTAKFLAEKLALDNSRRNEDTADKLRKSHQEENSDLHRQIKILTDERDSKPKEKSQGIQQSIAGYENTWRNLEAKIVDQYETALAKNKDKANQVERHYQTQNSENLTERNRYYTDLLAKKDHEAHEEKRDLLSSQDRNEAKQELQLKREREQALANSERLMTNANEGHAEALKAQANAFKSTLATTQKIHSDEKTTLENALKNSGDPKHPMNNLSPTVEAALRKSVITDYEKTLAAEKNRHQQALESVQENYGQRITEMTTQNARELAKNNRAQTSAQELERRELLNQIQDVEFNKNENFRNKEMEANRQTHILNQSYSNMLERQRRSYEEAMQNLKSDSSYKFNLQRQDSENELKSTRREFNALQNQTIRDHEKKMTEFKTQYEGQIEDLKTQSGFALHDLEKKGKIALDEQARTYEQRLTQLEQQHQERERYMSENFQEQLEKVKRSNALHYAKKG